MHCDVTFVLPCLDEAEALPFALDSAFAAVSRLERLGHRCEVILADNGSTDGSREIAAARGARVVPVEERGYGAALIGGFRAARGRFLVMGDADGSYDFEDALPMIDRLAAGADICMGSRFRGGIEPGAMPWKNRWIGNPLLTGILNLLFRAGVDDAHCGLRALTKSAFERLRLSGTGMEFASEMLVKAALLRLRIDETPATLRKDRRGRPPHLRPWRDGWRHLRYLLMLSPAAVFAWPAACAAVIGCVLMGMSLSYEFLGVPPGPLRTIGPNWTILAASLISLAHLSALMGAAAHLYGTAQGFRPRGEGGGTFRSVLTLEVFLAGGLIAMLSGLAVLVSVASVWSAGDFSPLPSITPAVVGTLLVTTGLQSMFGGFLLAVIGGNDANFVEGAERSAEIARNEARSARAA